MYNDPDAASWPPLPGAPTPAAATPAALDGTLGPWLTTAPAGTPFGFLNVVIPAPKAKAKAAPKAKAKAKAAPEPGTNTEYGPDDLEYYTFEHSDDE